MAPIRENVTLSARLVGMGHNVNCSVRVTKVSQSGTAVFSYTRPIPYNLPPNLADGPYDITYNGETHKVERKFGSWISRTI
jgi:hypothetical protein